MSDRTFTITLSDEERIHILYAIAFFMSIIGQNVPVVASTTIFELQNKLTRALCEQPDSGTEAAKAILAPPTPVHQPPEQTRRPIVDRWQRSKKGVEVPFPEGCETIEAELWKVESKPTQQGAPRWKVTWAAPGGQGFVDGSCFDEKLFPYLANRVKQKTVLYVVRNGKYNNVVGVKA